MSEFEVPLGIDIAAFLKVPGECLRFLNVTVPSVLLLDLLAASVPMVAVLPLAAKAWSS